jgi:hypothetical protein
MANYIGGAIARSGGKIPPLEKFLPDRTPEKRTPDRKSPEQIRAVMTQWMFVKAEPAKGKPRH